MRYENKFWQRQGKVFSMAREAVDLSDLRLLHAGVDTVKQLYNCILRSDIYDLLDRAASGDAINLGGIDWAFSRSSKQTGYQFILKNQDIGYVVLLKSFYREADIEGAHLKIEVSPWVIYENDPRSLTKKIDFIARVFAEHRKPSGVAVHMAADIKNLKVPEDFEKRFVCKARRQVKFNSISHAHFESMKDVAVIYGDRQTFTYGQPGAVQFTLYDKIAETDRSDKRTFWEHVWSYTPSIDHAFLPEYAPGDSVRRIELRFHHSVIDQFCNGTLEMADFSVHRTYERLIPHLTALWRYGLDCFRLQHSTSYIDPLWQLLIEDIEILHPQADACYKRAMKKPSLSTRRNIGFFLGNFIRVATRKRLAPEYLTKTILMLGIESELADYFDVPLFGGDCALQMALLDFISKRMEQLILDGVAA